MKRFIQTFCGMAICVVLVLIFFGVLIWITYLAFQLNLVFGVIIGFILLCFALTVENLITERGEK